MFCPYGLRFTRIKILQSKAGSLPDHDQIFAEAISKTRVVTGFTLTAAHSAPPCQSGFAHSGEDPLAYLPLFMARFPICPRLKKRGRQRQF